MVSLPVFAVLGLGSCLSEADSPATSISADSTTTSVAGTVGLIGCSMTVDAAEGYRRVGGTTLWRPRGLGYGGGTVARWSNRDDPRELWSGFEAALSREPDTSSVWWQLCTDGSPEDDLDHALAVLEEIERRLPGARVLVSAQPGYADGHICRSAGEDGPVRMAELAQLVVERSSAGLGPVMSELHPSQLRDTCHADQAGKEQMGNELVTFFDGNTTEAG